MWHWGMSLGGHSGDGLDQIILMFFSTLMILWFVEEQGIPDQLIRTTSHCICFGETDPSHIESPELIESRNGIA